MEKMIITMPLTPYSNFSVGKLSTPILAETLCKIFSAEFLLSVNLLDSYHKRDISEFKSLLSKYNINPDRYWIDVDNVTFLLEKLYFLIDQGYIKKVEKEILTCSCGKVEIPKDNMFSINMVDSCFELLDGSYYCKSCGCKCKFSTRLSLVFDPTLIKDNTLNFFPDFINKDVKTFYSTVASHDILVSRERNTGIKIDYEGHEFNIDIDFLWQIYLSLFPDKDKVVICSNHQLYQLFLVGLLEKCFENTGKTLLIATPYLNLRDKEEASMLESRCLSLKIVSILNQRWSRKENNFDIGLAKYVNTMNVEKKQLLYDIMIEEVNAEDFESELKLVLTKKMSSQRLIQELKRRRNNV